jgi:hypothetical protein
MGELISLCLEVNDDPLIVCDLPQQFAIDRLLAEVLADEGLGIRHALASLIRTVAVLMVLKACSTTQNFSISASILSLSILLTKTWVRYTILQCFSVCILSWMAREAISASSTSLIELALLMLSFYSIMASRLQMCSSLSRCSSINSARSCSYTFPVRSCPSCSLRPSLR